MLAMEAALWRWSQQFPVAVHYTCQRPAVNYQRLDGPIRDCCTRVGDSFPSPQGAAEEQVLGNAHSRSALCQNSRASKPQKELCISTTADEQSSMQAVSRRNWLISSAALAVLTYSDNAHGLSNPKNLGISSGGISGTIAYADMAVPMDVQQPAEDVKLWYRYRGTGFVLRIPPGYEDVLDYAEEDDENSLYGKRAEEKRFAARFASPDRNEVLSVVVKPATQLRLSFFETKDISDLGTIKDAAKNFVPAGAELVSARIVNSKASRVPRTYYVYEFLVNGMHFTMSAGVARGQVFVLGASSPQDKWKDYGTRLKLAASTFFLP